MRDFFRKNTTAGEMLQLTLKSVNECQWFKSVLNHIKNRALDGNFSTEIFIGSGYKDDVLGGYELARILTAMGFSVYEESNLHEDLNPYERDTLGQLWLMSDDIDGMIYDKIYVGWAPVVE